MSDITRLGITTAFCCVIFIVEGLTESGILLLVPAGGTYDPETVWNTDIADLVGVNDCQEDETLDVVELATKGTFRNARMFNLSYYENVKLDFLVYSEHGETLLNVPSCQMTDTVTCTFGSQTLTMGTVSWKDGFKLFANNTQDTLLSVFNPRHYFSEAPNGVSIIISSNSQVDTFPDPGHKGCYEKPSTGGTPLPTLTLESCFSSCTSDTYFLVSATECFCVSALTPKEDESLCMELCPGDNEQICGSATTASAYTSSSFGEFRDFYNGLNQTEVLQNETVDETSTGKVTFGTPTYINAAEVVVEEECQLTNLYFDQPPTSFSVLVDSDCSNTNPNYHTTLDGSGNLESFSAVQAKCVYLHPETNNYTYPRARIIIYGPTGNIKDVGGMFVIKGTWTIPEESSSLSSMVEETSSVDISSTDIQLTATDQTIMPSTSMRIASPTVGISNTYSIDGSTMEATPTIDASAASTPEATLGATAAHSDATISATGPSSGATIAATAASSASSTSSTAAAATTTTQGTGVATTTSKPKIYTKDGRLIYEACTCKCKQPPLKENQTPMEQAKVKAQELSEELQVNIKNLSATIRKKESASDERPSASAGGYVACALMGVMGVLFIAADVISISAHIQMLKSNVGSMFGKN